MRPWLLLPLLVVAGCGGGEDTVSSSPPAAATALTIDYTAQPGAEPQRWTLTCDPVGGSHPQAGEACRALAATDEPFAPVPPDAICTEQYGGPQAAVVRGTYRGEAVDLALSRVNGCYISQWERLVPLVPPAA